MADNKVSFLGIGESNYSQNILRMVKFINKEQLYNAELWKKFVNVYKRHDDSDDYYWRGEFWGKMMRGAALCYHYENDEKLYKVLRDTVLDMLSAQDDLGRFSSYRVDQEFHTWDVWGRKYVMTSMIHFYNVCKEEDLKNRIINALKKHADYMIDHIGNKKGQIGIAETGTWWLGVNSCSILEPFVDLYKITKEDRYLKFAKYIVSTGGISEGNLIKCAKEHKLMPYQYPEAKAYETMSFFEGVLEYADVVKDKELHDIAISFFEDVNNTEISIIGNAGAEEENFSNGYINQTIRPIKFMQETCVSVTWMRVLTKLYLKTGDPKYMDRFSRTSWNCFYGSVNFNHQSSRDYFAKKQQHALPFDSYSPLVADRRGWSTGGLQYLKDGGIYGCCACIGAAGIGLTALNAVTQDKDNIYINDYYSGEIKSTDGILSITSTYAYNGKVVIRANKLNKDIVIRVPSWSTNAIIIADHKKIDIKKKAYINLGKAKIIEINFKPEVVKQEINNAVCFTYGEITLGIDEEANPWVWLEDMHADKIKNIHQIKAKGKELVRFVADYDNKKLIFKDYADLAKNWDSPNNRLSVWMNH